VTGLPQIRFTTATALINELVEAAHANQLGRALDFLPIVKTRNAAVRENCPLYGSYVDEVRQVPEMWHRLRPDQGSSRARGCQDRAASRSARRGDARFYRLV
jgi:hypothetical protein